MKSLLKRLCWIVAIGIISYSYHLDRCYSAVLGPQTQRQEYHMDLPDETVKGYYNIYKTRSYGRAEMLEVELTDIVRQKSNEKIVRLNIASNRLGIDRYFDNSYEQIYIYFPQNGRQPTTEKAVRWSCANADSDMSEGDRLQSPITDWYMKLFGVIDKNGGNSANDDDYIKAGYDGNNQSKRIISYDANMTPEQRQTFIDNFRKIASTSVGRVLLYRLLIEIRRVDREGKGCEDLPETSQYSYVNFMSEDIDQNKGRILRSNVKKIRDVCRFVTVRHGGAFRFCAPNALSFTSPILPNIIRHACIDVNFGNRVYALCKVISCKGGYEGETLFCKQPAPFDVNIFHEMIHLVPRIKISYKALV